MLDPVKIKGGDVVIWRKEKVRIYQVTRFWRPTKCGEYLELVTGHVHLYHGPFKSKPEGIRILLFCRLAKPEKQK